jgi:hypothetical protein
MVKKTSKVTPPIFKMACTDTPKAVFVVEMTTQITYLFAPLLAFVSLYTVGFNDGKTALNFSGGTWVFEGIRDILIAYSRRCDLSLQRY